MYYIKYTIFVYVYIQTLRIRMYLKNREKTQKKEKKLKKKKVGGACDTPSAAPPPLPPLSMRVTCPVVQEGHPIGRQLAILVARSECDTDLSARI